MKERLFAVSAKQYSDQHDFSVYYPASLDKPCDHAVMFINEKNIGRADRLCAVSNCIVFCPRTLSVPAEVLKENLIVPCDDPRTAFCLFFRENHIDNQPKREAYETVGGAMIATTARIGENVTIMPQAYIGGEVSIGDGSYIGAGVKLMGKVKIGRNVIIRENSVIGADGLSTDRDENGKAATMPQFGGVSIGDHVRIGALTVIARGAIDDTVIAEGTKIDNSCFISHNVHVGEDTFIVGETIMFGGSSTQERAFISGNSTIRNKAAIGSDAFIGMGAVVAKDVEAGACVFGNPARTTNKGEKENG